MQNQGKYVFFRKSFIKCSAYIVYIVDFVLLHVEWEIPSQHVPGYMLNLEPGMEQGLLIQIYQAMIKY